ncbi:MAG: acyl-CoA dehydrogenase family protein [Balneolaceae bacterium]
MELRESVQTNWEALTNKIGKEFAERANKHDRDGDFVFENYETLKKHRYFSAMIPEELGGGGISHTEMCDVIRILAKYCGSTALAFSMHQHLVAATIWKYKHKGIGASTLQNVAEHQTVLVSTGARDWLESNGEMEKVENGYLFSGRKHFASQSIAGDVAVTSAPFSSPDEMQVLHFQVPLNTSGVSILDDWDVLGMRSTGSQTIVFDKVFIPDSAIALARPQSGFHPVWNVVLTVAMPLIMSAYIGLAERAMEIAVSKGKKYHRNQSHITYIIGKLNNRLLSAQTQWTAMFTLTNNFDFTPSEDTTIKMLSLKTNVAEATKATVAEAMEAIGGQSFYKKNELERIFRDVQASAFHPLPKWDQYAFTGQRLMQD